VLTHYSSSHPQPRLMHGDAHHAVDRARYGLDGWAHYSGQRGQVLVFRDVLLRQALRTDAWCALLALMTVKLEEHLEAG